MRLEHLLSGRKEMFGASRPSGQVNKEHLLSGRKEMFGAARPSGQVNKEHLLSGSMSRRVKPMQYFFLTKEDDASVSVTKRMVAPAAVERLYKQQL